MYPKLKKSSVVKELRPWFILCLLSILLGIVTLFMAFPLGIALYKGEKEAAEAFLIPIVSILPLSLLSLGLILKDKQKKLSTRGGFLLVLLSWIGTAALSALPYYISGGIPSYTDSYFEAMSGLTTTGASILTSIESLPSSLLFWRALTHWLGGMGIVVLTVAIFPLLGIGGVQLVKAEAPGPSVSKLTPKIAETAKILWFLYIGLTLLETLLLWLGGMTLFDALTHSFATMATGGFSTKNISVGYYASPFIHWVITIFMILAGVNFVLYFKIITGRFQEFFEDSEMKAYFLIIVFATLITALSLQTQQIYGSFGESLQYAAFQVASIVTTTGFATADYDLWPSLSQVILFMTMFIGGCAGSTGGGVKVVRVLTLLKVSIREMKKLLYPRAVFHIRLNKVALHQDIIAVITGFIFLYILSLLLTTAVVSLGGYDVLTSFSTALATVGNIGPGFNLVGPSMNYAFFDGGIKWFLSGAMLLGRLELYTLLVVFLPAFWQSGQ